MNYRLVICESGGDRCGNFILMSRCVRHWGFPDVSLDIWSYCSGGLMRQEAGEIHVLVFREMSSDGCFAPKMGSGQISVEVTVVASILDAGVWVLLLQKLYSCLLYTSPSPRDRTRSRMPSSA